ncbi:MAG: DUF2194 domain-containing protein [Anaerocolumna sp.]
MIKKVYFFQLTLLMLLLFILFQITSTSITFNDLINSFQSNGNNLEKNNSMNSRNVNNSDSVLLITGDNESKVKYIEEELLYLHKDYREEKSLLALTDEELKNTEVIILASYNISDAYNLETVQKCMNKGINIIMAIVPGEIELDKDWCSFLGIKTLNGGLNQEGISIFSDFLIGGKHDYPKLKLDIQNIKVLSNCKTYIAGFPKDNNGEESSGDIPDILWRNVYSGSQIYVVNGSFFDNGNGIGIICSIFSQMYEDFIYPVINAKALLVNNAPYLSNENGNEMQKRYARNSQRFLEDIVLPDIIALCMSTKNVPTFYAVSSLDGESTYGNELNTPVLSIVNGELKKIGGEMGISVFDRTDINVEEKTTEAINLFKNQLGSDYEFNSLYFKNHDNLNDTLVNSVNKLTTVHSLVSPWDEGTTFSHYNRDVINIPVITEGFTYNDEDLFKLHSLSTALGVIIQGIDMNDIVYPESNSYDWTNAYVDLTSATDTYLAGYKYLDGLNITGVESRVSRFLDSKPNIIQENNSIKISIYNFQEEVFFILRTNKKVADINNGNAERIEDNAYLISANGADVTITLKE